MEPAVWLGVPQAAVQVAACCAEQTMGAGRAGAVVRLLAFAQHCQ